MSTEMAGTVAMEQASGSAEPGLGSTTNSASPSAEGRVIGRFALQNVARRLLPEHRVAACLRLKRPDAGDVQVLFDPEHGAAHYGGLIVCGSAWVCPVCASHITERRRVELQTGLEQHSELTAVMLTVTLQHGRRDGLGELMAALKEGMRGARSGKRWQAMKASLQIVGSVTSTEVTWGEKTGWHPHEHILFLCAGEVDPGDVEALRVFISERFGAYLARDGRYVSPVFGVSAVVGDAAAGAYLSKWGSASELTKANVKVARSADRVSPFGLLALAGDGDKRAARLFREFADAVHGRRLLTYTRGLRALLGLGDDVSDETIAEQPVESAVILASFTVHQWRVILSNDCRGELLAVASSGDPERLWAWLSELWREPDG
jgi:hypothetical protein